MANDLLFERFLTPGRRIPPDIDLDFCSRRRTAAPDSVPRPYTDDRVATLPEMNTCTPLSAARRRWTDPAFPMAFPWFNTQKYWQDRVLELKEQVAAMQETPLVPAR